MEHHDLLRQIAIVFDRLCIRYFVTGSTATIIYGEPRFTNDIDVVVELTADMIDGLLTEFPSQEYYMSRTAIENAIRHHRQFNIIHPSSGLKIDVIVADQSEFDRSRMLRARSLPIFKDQNVRFAAPEDVILKKMVFFLEGESGKHLRDIAGVLQSQIGKIDQLYVEEWATRLGVHEIWQRVRVVSDKSA